MTSSKYRTEFNEIIGRRNLLIAQLREKKQVLADTQIQYESLVKARWVLAEVSRITQNNFSQYVESLVTLAIQAVFNRPFKFIANFEIRRNKSECFLQVQDGPDNEPFFPKDEMGGGLLDIISIALRIVFWSLEKPRSRSLFILDEPMKFVGKGEMFKKAVMLLKDISQRLGVQFIVNTHEETIAEIADRCWLIEHDGTKSHVQLMDLQNKGTTPEYLLRRRSRGVPTRSKEM